MGLFNVSLVQVKLFMDELKDTLKSVFDKRLSNSFLVSYGLSILAVNWRVVYTTVFVDQEVILELYETDKLSHILSLYQSNMDIVLFLLVFPLAITIFIEWPASMIDEHFYDNQLKNKELKAMKLDESKQRIAEKRKERLNVEIDVVDKEAEVKEKSKVIRTDEEVWMDELVELKKKRKNFKEYMDILKVLIYEQSGYKGNMNLSANEMSFWDSNKLIDDIHSQVRLTEKGKFFMKNYE